MMKLQLVPYCENGQEIPVLLLQITWHLIRVGETQAMKPIKSIKFNEIYQQVADAMVFPSNVLYSCKKLIAFSDAVKDRKRYKLDYSIKFGLQGKKI